MFVTFCLIARPFLLKLQGRERAGAARACWPSRVRVDEPGTPGLPARDIGRRGCGPALAHRFPNQSSGVLSSVSHSDALDGYPPGTTVAEGDKVEVILLDLLA